MQDIAGAAVANTSGTSQHIVGRAATVGMLSMAGTCASETVAVTPVGGAARWDVAAANAESDDAGVPILGEDGHQTCATTGEECTDPCRRS